MMLSFVIKDAPLAQSAEQDTLNVKVAGSIPAGRTKPVRTSNRRLQECCATNKEHEIALGASR